MEIVMISLNTTTDFNSESQSTAIRTLISYTFIFTFVIGTSSMVPLLYAQPENMLVTYINYEEIPILEPYDIYDAGEILVMTGNVAMDEQPFRQGLWLAGASTDGEVIWQNVYYPEDRGLIRCRGNSVIQTDDGGFVVGGDKGGFVNLGFSVLKVDAERNMEWWSDLGQEYVCYVVIELKDDNILAGGGYSRPGDMFLALLDQDGEVIWTWTYEDRGIIWAIRETDDGYLLAGYRFLLKIDAEGDVIWETEFDAKIWDMITTDHGGIMLCGVEQIDRETRDESFALIRVDAEGREEWFHNYRLENGGANTYGATGLARATDGGYTLVGGPGSSPAAYILHTDPQGNEIWQRGDQWGNSRRKYRSVVIDQAGHAYAVGSCTVGDRRSGVLVKIAPELPAPQIISHIPQDLEFTVLPDDSVWFAVYAVDQQDDDMYYTWTFGEDTVSTDTSTTITFPSEFGEYAVKCVVSDGVLADTVAWQVTVGEFLIDSYSPDTLIWRVRRPWEGNFSLDVRAVEGFEPLYRWILSNRNNQGENDIGDEADLNYLFNLGGRYSLEAKVFSERVEYSVQWQIEVSSVLWWWTPHALVFTLSINADTSFSVIPSNPDSDSLEFQWLVDGEILEDIDEGIEHSFDSAGIHTVTAIVHDGAEVDTVDWTVTVNPNSVNDGVDVLLPTEVTLYPAAPNPFNSTTSIRYFLPRSADVRLTVYDLAGRIVQTLNEGFTIAGKHRATLQGAELTAGVYLLQMEAGDDIHSLKLVLLK